MIDLTDKGFCIFGLKGSGKSWLLNRILDYTADHIVYDPLEEHEGYRRYIPTDRTSIDELSRFVRRVVIPEKPALFAIDEANRYMRNHHPLPDGIDDLNDFARHWGISAGYICRRPVQFNTDIVELADILFFYSLNGKNDYRYMEDLFRGLGDAVRDLPEFHYVSLTGGKELQLHAAIEQPVHVTYTGRRK